MPTQSTHKVRAGEKLATIARKHGYGTYKEIWDHRSNAALRKKRQAPEKIQPGDVIELPPTKAELAAKKRADELRNQQIADMIATHKSLWSEAKFLRQSAQARQNEINRLLAEALAARQKFLAECDAVDARIKSQEATDKTIDLAFIGVGFFKTAGAMALRSVAKRIGMSGADDAIKVANKGFLDAARKREAAMQARFGKLSRELSTSGASKELLIKQQAALDAVSDMIGAGESLLIMHASAQAQSTGLWDEFINQLNEFTSPSYYLWVLARTADGKGISSVESLRSFKLKWQKTGAKARADLNKIFAKLEAGVRKEKAAIDEMRKQAAKLEASADKIARKINAL